MIDTRTLDIAALLPLCCGERRCKLMRLKNDSAKRSCIGAELAMIRAVREEYPAEPLPLTYARNENGKPYLPQHPQLHISVSHSGDYALCVSSDKPVGADIQRVRRADMRIARRFFTDDECEYIGSDTGRFFEIWTKKEAFVKACGSTLGEMIGTSSVLGADCVFTRADAPDGYTAWICELNGQEEEICV